MSSLDAVDLSLLLMAKEGQAPEQGAESGIFATVPRNPRWKTVRDAVLKQCPACAACGDKRLLNVHHKKPFHLFPDLELEPANLIVLCEVPSHSCHFALGHCFDWRAYNPFVEEDARARMERIAQRQY